MGAFHQGPSICGCPDCLSDPSHGPPQPREGHPLCRLPLLPPGPGIPEGNLLGKSQWQASPNCTAHWLDLYFRSFYLLSSLANIPVWHLKDSNYLALCNRNILSTSPVTQNGILERSITSLLLLMFILQNHIHIGNACSGSIELKFTE